MPYYQLFMPEGVLTDSSRSAIAKEITHIHCEETGAPESFVHVVFQAIKKGTQYTAGEIDDQVGVFLGMIREGRSIKERQRRRLRPGPIECRGKPGIVSETARNRLITRLRGGPGRTLWSEQYQ